MAGHVICEQPKKKFMENIHIHWELKESVPKEPSQRSLAKGASAKGASAKNMRTSKNGQRSLGQRSLSQRFEN